MKRKWCFSLKTINNVDENIIFNWIRNLFYTWKHLHFKSRKIFVFFSIIIFLFFIKIHERSNIFGTTTFQEFINAASQQSCLDKYVKISFLLGNLLTSYHLPSWVRASLSGSSFYLFYITSPLALSEVSPLVLSDCALFHSLCKSMGALVSVTLGLVLYKWSFPQPGIYGDCTNTPGLVLIDPPPI